MSCSRILFRFSWRWRGLWCFHFLGRRRFVRGRRCRGFFLGGFLIRLAPIIGGVKTRPLENNSGAGPEQSFHLAVAPFRQATKLLRTLGVWLVPHRLKRFEVQVAFFAVIFVGRHGGNKPRESLLKPKHNSSRARALNWLVLAARWSSPVNRSSLTLAAIPVEGSTENFLCVIHFIFLCRFSLRLHFL